MAPLHLQSQKLPHKTKWLWKVGPQVLPTRIFHKRSPLFQQECLRQGLHCTLEAHESCTFCAGRLIAGKVIKTLQTWRYVWSFTNLWRLNVIKWAGEITNLYKKFNKVYIMRTQACTRGYTDTDTGHSVWWLHKRETLSNGPSSLRPRVLSQTQTHVYARAFADLILIFCKTTTGVTVLSCKNDVASPSAQPYVIFTRHSGGTL